MSQYKTTVPPPSDSFVFKVSQGVKLDIHLGGGSGGGGEGVFVILALSKWIGSMNTLTISHHRKIGLETI